MPEISRSAYRKLSYQGRLAASKARASAGFYKGHPHASPAPRTATRGEGWPPEGMKAQPRRRRRNGFQRSRYPAAFTYVPE